jgi:ABC-type multidrug transport system fused ATPase/permease subunit
MNNAIVEFLGGTPVIKMFGGARSNPSKTSEAIRAYARIERELSEAFIPFGGAFFALIMAGITVIVPVGAWLMATRSA